MNTAKITPESVLEERRRIEKVLCERYSLTKVDLAAFFETTVKVITKDLESLGIKEDALSRPSKPSANGAIMNQRRNAKLAKELNAHLAPENEILRRYGLWRKPKSFEDSEYETILNSLALRSLKNDETLLKVIKFCCLGLNHEDAKALVGGHIEMYEKAALTSAHTAGVLPAGHSALDNDPEAVNFAVKKAKEAGIQFAKNVSEAKKMLRPICDLTGITPAVLLDRLEIKKIEQREPNEKQLKKNALKSEVYRRWKSGEATQQELADEYGITRNSIMNYIREEKLADKESLKEPLVLRQKNRKAVDQEAYEKQVLIVQATVRKLKKNEEYPSCGVVSKLTGIPFALTKKIMQENGMTPVVYENSSLSVLVKGEAESIKVYSAGMLSHFGYGPNAGITKENKPTAVQEKEALLSQIKMGIAADENFKKSRQEAAGGIMQYYLPKNKRALAELEEADNDNRVLA